MGRMSIVAEHPEKGMEIVRRSSDQRSSEQSWLDVVKAAVRPDERGLHSRGSIPCSLVVEPSWIHLPKDKKKSAGKSGTYDYIGDLLSRIEYGLNNDKVSGKPYVDEEQELIRDLREKLERKENFTEEIFLGLLKPYLLVVRSKEGEILEHKQNDEPHSNGFVSVADRKPTLTLLRKAAPSLSPRLVSLLLECSIFLRLWSAVQVLLERRVVDTRDCSKVVEGAIEDHQARTLCHCVTYVPDLAPQDVFALLTYFLNSIEKPPKSFLVVKGEWKRLALQKIQKYSSKKDAVSEGGQVPSSESAIALAVAFDGFSPAELCLHTLVASELDESVLSSVFSNLDTSQLLSLLQYLCKWVELYSAQLARHPNPKIGRIPTMTQVLYWAGIILEGNYTKFVLSTDYHAVMKAMRNLAQPLVDLCTHITPLIGIVDHLRYRRYIPAAVTRAQVPSAPTDYVIELLDLS